MNEEENSRREQIMYHTITITEVFAKKLPMGYPNLAEAVNKFMEKIHSKIIELYKKDI